MTSKYLFTITAEHVRDPVRALGRKWYKLGEAIGRPLKIDIGKRVFEVTTSSGSFYQVENDEQRDSRIKRDGGDKPVWDAPTYPGSPVRQQLLCIGKPITDLGDVRIMDYYDLADPKSPKAKHNYCVASFCPGEMYCSPGDTPKGSPEHSEWCTSADEANALFDKFIAERKTENWREYDRNRGDRQ